MDQWRSLLLPWHMEIRFRTIQRLRDALIQSGSRRSPVTSSAFKTLARERLFTKQEETALARVDAAAETMFLVIAADQTITDAELAALKGAIIGLTGDALNDDLIQVLTETFAVRLRDEGRAARLAHIGKAMADQNEAQNTFALAAAAALADGKVQDEESELIRELREIFGLTKEQVSSVFEELALDERS